MPGAPGCSRRETRLDSPEKCLGSPEKWFKVKEKWCKFMCSLNINPPSIQKQVRDLQKVWSSVSAPCASTCSTLTVPGPALIYCSPPLPSVSQRPGETTSSLQWSCCRWGNNCLTRWAASGVSLPVGLAQPAQTLCCGSQLVVLGSGLGLRDHPGDHRLHCPCALAGSSPTGDTQSQCTALVPGAPTKGWSTKRGLPGRLRRETRTQPLKNSLCCKEKVCRAKYLCYPQPRDAQLAMEFSRCCQLGSISMAMLAKAA